MAALPASPEPSGDAAAGAPDLLARATTAPRAVRREAGRRLAGEHDPRTRSLLRQAEGIAARELGDLPAALAALRAAVAEARTAGADDRTADVLATLATTLVAAGRRAEGWAVFAEARRATGPLGAARIDVRRAALLDGVEGRAAEALAVYRRAIPLLHRHGDTLWEARARNNRGLAYLARHELAAARTDLAHAARLYEAAGQPAAVARVAHNQAVAASLAGDLPAAFALFDDAERRYHRSGIGEPALPVDRSLLLLGAGMPGPARRQATAALELAAANPTRVWNRFGALLAAAEAELECDDAAAARRHATAAARLAGRLGNGPGLRRARLLAAAAATVATTGPDAAGRAGRSRRTAPDLDPPAGGPPPTAAERLLAARIALARGDADAPDRLRAAAQAIRRGPALDRLAGWTARALLADTRGSARGVAAATAAGRRVLSDHRLSLGASELRAHASRHGRELARLAVRHAARSGDPRRLLATAESWRAALLGQPPVRPPADPALARDLAVVRSAVRDERAATTADAAARLRALRAAAEQRILRHTRATPAPGADGARAGTVGAEAGILLGRVPGSSPPGGVAELTVALGAAALVDVVDVDGDLVVLVVRAGRVRRFAGGSARDARELAAGLLATLRSAALGGPAAAALLTATLAARAAALQRVVLGAATGALGDAPVVVSAPASLLGAPWGLLPALRHRPWSLVPSVAAYLRAAATAPPRRGTVALVAGPDLPGARAEVGALAAADPGAVVLTGADATCAAVRRALDGAALGHVAAHGTFRADNPLFSALLLADGPLMVYDLETLRRAPFRLVLSACESGVGEPVGAGEMLGLATTLLAHGTAGLVASLVPVRDDATRELSLAVHEALRAGADVAGALQQARTAGAAAGATGDPLPSLAAASFVAVGAR